MIPRGAAAQRALATFSSVDPNEQAKFAHAAKDWWDASSTGGAGLLHALNPVRVRYLVEHVLPEIRTPAAAAGLRVADIGCGGGLLSESLARLGAAVVGVDPTEAAVAVARAHAAPDPLTAAIDYRLTTVEALVDPAEGGEAGGFDLVCSLEVVEHTPDPDAFVRGCAALVRPGGCLAMSTMNRTRKAWLFAIAGAEHLGRLLPVGTHDWARFRTPEEMAAAMEGGGGLCVRDVSGIVLDPFALRSLASAGAWKIDGGDTDVNFIMFGTRPLPREGEGEPKGAEARAR